MRTVTVALVMTLAPLVARVFSAEQARPTPNARNPGMVKEVLDGKRSEANAAWWGFDEADATDAIQSALNSGARRVVIPNMGKDWIVRPIRLRGNQEIVFEPGVVVTAKKGEFKSKTDCLFRAVGQSNITLRGYGATLRMQKPDYTTDAYEKAEWRHGLSFLSCNDVTVLGLIIRDTGGDGIYIGQERGAQPFCKGVQISNVICDNNHRQGISVISAENLLIENTILKNTNGTAPQDGIDLEPNNPTERLANCVLRNCVMENNLGAGIGLYLKYLSAQSADVSMRFENCRIASAKGTGVRLGALKDDGPKGSIEFINCVIEDMGLRGASISDKSADRALLRFTNCVWKNVATIEADPAKKISLNVPFLLSASKAEITQNPGGIEFRNCVFDDRKDRPFLTARAPKGDSAIRDIRGTVTVRNPYGARMDLGSKTESIDLKVTSVGANAGQEDRTMSPKAQNEKGTFQGKTIAEWRAQLGDKQETVRLSAAVALGECGPKAAPALIEELKNKDSVIRYWAARGLGKIGRPAAESAVPALAKALKDSSEVVRVSAAYALWKLGQRTDAMAALIKSLEDGSAGAKLEVVNDLCLIGPDAKEALPAVRKAAEQKSADYVYSYVIRKASTDQKIFEGKSSFGE